MNAIEFLLARYAEEEAAARGSLEYGEGQWRWIDPHTDKVKQALVDERGRTVLPSALGDAYPSVSVANHIAMHDPARVLADVEAKRRVVAAIEEHQVLWETSTVREAVLYALASAYSTHPDYSQRWKP